MRLHIEKSAGLYLIPFYIRRGGPGYREKNHLFFEVANCRYLEQERWTLRN